MRALKTTEGFVPRDPAQQRGCCAGAPQGAGDYNASMIALKVALGRIARSAFTGSGR